MQRFLKLMRDLVWGGRGAGKPRDTIEDARERSQGTTHQSAAMLLVDLEYVNSLRYREKVVECDRRGSDPQIIEFYQHLNRALFARGFPFYAYEFLRSNERQAELKAKGRSKAGPGQSPHNHGMAVDVIHCKRGWDLSREEWDIVGAIGKEVARKRKIPIEWGGDWAFWDPAHWQLADWRNRVR